MKPYAVIPMLLAAAALGPQVCGAVTGAGSQSYTLELNGLQCGPIHWAAGGGSYVQVSASPVNWSATYQYNCQDIVMELGFDLNKPLFSAIDRFLRQDGGTLEGAVRIGTMDRQIASQVNFRQAMVTEFTIPECVADGKSPSYFGLVIKPSGVDYRITTPSGDAPPAGKPLIGPRFRLEIPGLDCQRVSRIDTMTCKWQENSESIGHSHGPALWRGSLIYPTLKLRLPAARTTDWFEWHEQCRRDPSRVRGLLKTGTLTFLSPDLKTDLVKISFTGLGIARFQPLVPDDADLTNFIEVDLFMDGLTIDLPEKSPSGSGK